MNMFVSSVGVDFGEDEVYLSFLPLAHIFDRWVLLTWGLLYNHRVLNMFLKEMNDFWGALLSLKSIGKKSSCVVFFLPSVHHCLLF